VVHESRWQRFPLGGHCFFEAVAHGRNRARKKPDPLRVRLDFLGLRSLGQQGRLWPLLDSAYRVFCFHRRQAKPRLRPECLGSGRCFLGNRSFGRSRFFGRGGATGLRLASLRTTGAGSQAGEQTAAGLRRTSVDRGAARRGSTRLRTARLRTAGPHATAALGTTSLRGARCRSTGRGRCSLGSSLVGRHRLTLTSQQGEAEHRKDYCDA